jgi:hypothetical protein
MTNSGEVTRIVLKFFRSDIAFKHQSLAVTIPIDGLVDLPILLVDSSPRKATEIGLHVARGMLVSCKTPSGNGHL